MCKVCGHKNGTTRHLLYWQAEWFKRFLLTWWHIVNRRAYYKWQEKQNKKKAEKVFDYIIGGGLGIDEGHRMEVKELLD